VLVSVLTYGVLIEVEPGLTRPAIACTPDDLARARALEALRGTIRHDLATLVADAIRYDLDIPAELRERVALWTGGITDGEQLAQELRDALFARV
jgi:hypothetical protein